MKIEETEELARLDDFNLNRAHYLAGCRHRGAIILVNEFDLDIFIIRHARQAFLQGKKEESHNLSMIMSLANMVLKHILKDLGFITPEDDLKNSVLSSHFKNLQGIIEQLEKDIKK